MNKIFNQERIAALVVIILLVGGVWGIAKIIERNNPENQPRVYEALVNIVDQKIDDPIEDARSSLKKGDVIAYFSEGYNWSNTEKNSYLIVKLNLSPKNARKLTEAKTKKEGAQTKIILARKYRLELPEYNVQKFWENQEQPFKDKVFDKELIKKK